MKRAFVVLLCALLLALCACGQAEPEPAEAPATLEAPTAPREEIESIYHEITARIHPDMPEFTFALQGAWTRIYERNLRNGEVQYDADDMPRFRENTNISVIEIKEEEQFYQRLHGFETYQGKELENYGFELQDFNNDGYLDIALYYSPGAVDPNRLFWLWDKKQEEFVCNEQLQGLCADWQFFDLEDDGRIKLFSRSGGGIAWGMAWYEYRNGTFVLVESEDGEILFEKEDGESVPVGKHIVIKKLVNGKIRTVSDTTVKIEEGSETPWSKTSP